jgi:hypothetical protein
MAMQRFVYQYLTEALRGGNLAGGGLLRIALDFIAGSGPKTFPWCWRVSRFNSGGGPSYCVDKLASVERALSQPNRSLERCWIPGFRCPLGQLSRKGVADCESEDCAQAGEPAHRGCPLFHMTYIV